jgi:NADPH:quinone reductase-like Zn-dependent oxidoreductase
MKAVICTRYGPPEVLQLRDVPKPVPKENEVLVRVVATTVHVGDTRIRAFRVPLAMWIPSRLFLGIFKPRRPILGIELAGVIEDVGSGVTRYQVGDAVFAETLQSGFGGYAEYKCLPEALKTMAKKPADMSFEEAAAFPTGAHTALRLLRNASISPGTKVLVYGASGSVGTNAVQLAKHFGAEVTGVCSGKNVELVASLGAAKVVDYTKEDVAAADERYDVVFDAVGKLPRNTAQAVLKPGGIALSVMKGPFPEQPDDLEVLKRLYETGELRVVIDRTYPLEEIVEAHRYVDAGHKVGNVVIRIAEAGA